MWDGHPMGLRKPYRFDITGTIQIPIRHVILPVMISTSGFISADPQSCVVNIYLPYFEIRRLFCSFFSRSLWRSSNHGFFGDQPPPSCFFAPSARAPSSSRALRAREELAELHSNYARRLQQLRAQHGGEQRGFRAAEAIGGSGVGGRGGGGVGGLGDWGDWGIGGDWGIWGGIHLTRIAQCRSPRACHLNLIIS